MLFRSAQKVTSLPLQISCSVNLLRAPSVLLSNNRSKVHWAVYNMACPGNRMRFDLTVKDIETETDRLIKESKNVYDGIGKLSLEEANYDNVVKVICYGIFTQTYVIVLLMF